MFNRDYCLRTRNKTTLTQVTRLYVNLYQRGKVPDYMKSLIVILSQARKQITLGFIPLAAKSQFGTISQAEQILRGETITMVHEYSTCNL